MAFCENCGTRVEDGTPYCPNCGSRLIPPDQEPARSGADQQSWTVRQPETSGQYTSFAEDGPPVQPDPPMKWHKFLCYFSLWAGAVVYLINSVKTLTGAQYMTAYGNKKDEVYRAFPLLKPADLFVSLAYLGLAALAVVTALSLLRFKAKGPGLLTKLYVAGLICSVIYLIWGCVALSGGGTVVRLSDILPEVLPGLVISAVMILVNSYYYSKRAYLFVN